MTTDTNTTADTHRLTAEELQALTEEANAWMEATGRKLFPRAKQDELLEMGAKRCGRCTEVRRISEFNKDASRPDGLQAKCRPCKNGSNAEYMRELRTDEEYREREREQQREYMRELRTDPEFREREREHMRTRYTSDEMFRLRRQLNSGYHRAVEAGNPAERITAEDLLTYWSEKGIDPLRCIYTGEKLTPQDRSLDHCTPIGRGGTHTVDNIVPCTFEVNQAMGNRTVLEFLADRAAEQSNEEIDPLVQRALSTSAPVRKQRTVLVQLEEGADHE